VETPRGKVEAVAIVTSRLKPFNIAGQTIHQIGIPWHFGWLQPKDGWGKCQSTDTDHWRSQHDDP